MRPSDPASPRGPAATEFCRACRWPHASLPLPAGKRSCSWDCCCPRSANASSCPRIPCHRPCSAGGQDGCQVRRSPLVRLGRGPFLWGGNHSQRSKTASEELPACGSGHACMHACIVPCCSGLRPSGTPLWQGPPRLGAARVEAQAAGAPRKPAHLRGARGHEQRGGEGGQLHLLQG